MKAPCLGARRPGYIPFLTLRYGQPSALAPEIGANIAPFGAGDPEVTAISPGIWCHLS